MHNHNGINNPMYGKHHTRESKLKIGLKNKGKIRTKETKSKMSLAKKNFIFTKEHRYHISLAKKGCQTWLGKHHTEETKRKMSLTKTGKIFSEEHRKNMSLARIGEKSVWYKKHLPDEMRNKISLSHIGNKNPMFGKNRPYIKGDNYNGYYMKSSWEIIYAKWLDSKGYHWIYEPKRFYFINKPFTYLPDFWVDELNSYVEIKGWMDDLSKEKIDLFSKDNPLIVIRDIKPYKLTTK